MQQSPIEVRRAFGVLFVGVAAAVFTASILSDIAFEHRDPIYYYAIIWFGSFAVTFGIILWKFRNLLSSIRDRMKNSIVWPPMVKAVNGLCWAAPFAAIGVAPHYYQYLILFGIGLGNTSTFLFMKKYSGLVNPEQIIVGVISLGAIPLAVLLDTSIVLNQTIAVITSRIMIAVAYGVGGIFALIKK